MEWLTPTLFLFYAKLPEQGGRVEVIAEAWPGRRGDRDGSGRALEPDEAPEMRLWSVASLDRPQKATRWQRHERWLIKEAKRLWKAEKPT